MSLKVINRVVRSIIDVDYTIEAKGLSKEDMNRLLFIRNLTILIELEERRNLLEEKAGFDITMFEDPFYEVIENSFRMVFNADQVELIKAYLYELKPDENWDGVLMMDWDVYPQSPNTGESEVKFDTPAKVWDVIIQLKDIEE